MTTVKKDKHKKKPLHDVVSEYQKLKGMSDKEIKEYVKKRLKKV